MKHVRDVREPGLIYQAWSIKPILFYCYFFCAAEYFPFPRPLILCYLQAIFCIIHLQSPFRSTCQQVQFEFCQTVCFCCCSHHSLNGTNVSETLESKKWKVAAWRRKEAKNKNQERDMERESTYVLDWWKDDLFQRENFLVLLVFYSKSATKLTSGLCNILPCSAVQIDKQTTWLTAAKYTFWFVFLISEE